MRKVIAGFVLGFILNWSLSFAASLSKRNGIYWNQLGDAAKNGYVDGYSDAMHFSSARLDALNVAAELFHWKGATRILAQLSDQLSTNGLVSDEAIKEMDRLYSNRKFDELDVGQALQLVAIRTKGVRSRQPQSDTGK